MARRLFPGPDCCVWKKMFPENKNFDQILSFHFHPSTYDAPKNFKRTILHSFVCTIICDTFLQISFDLFPLRFLWQKRQKDFFYKGVHFRLLSPSKKNDWNIAKFNKAQCTPLYWTKDNSILLLISSLIVLQQGTWLMFGYCHQFNYFTRMILISGGQCNVSVTYEMPN